MTQAERDEKAQAAEYATFGNAQRDMLREMGCRLIVLASDPEATPVQVMWALEEAARAVSSMELRDMRSRWQCPGCLSAFTSKATMSQHYKGRRRECIDPVTLPQLEQKAGGKWGWSAQATEYFRTRAERGL